MSNELAQILEITTKIWEHLQRTLPVPRPVVAYNPGEDATHAHDWRDVGLITLRDPAIPVMVLYHLACPTPAILTMGQLHDYQARYGDHWWDGLLNQEELNAIQAAVNGFWKKIAEAQRREELWRSHHCAPPTRPSAEV